MQPIDLAIFYADGSIVECSKKDSVEITITFKVARRFIEAPPDGIQAIIQRDEFADRHVLRGKDNYFALPDGMINSADDMAPFLSHYFPGLFKRGVCLTDQYWADVMAEVKEYKGIPRSGADHKPRPGDDIR